MKQFVKALPVHGNCFNYICRVFPGMSNEKLKAGIFDGPQIRKLMNDPNFTASMTEKEFAAWISFTVVVKNFLGNNKANNYIQIVEDMLSKFQSLGAKMNIKIHYLFSHLDRFPENLGELSEEQGERFHQDIKVMEERYQGRWDTHMMRTIVGIFNDISHLLLTLESLTRGDWFRRFDRMVVVKAQYFQASFV